MQGTIVKALAGFYYVECEGKIYQTRARGNFRKKGQTPYVGDQVKSLEVAQLLRFLALTWLKDLSKCSIQTVWQS